MAKPETPQGGERPRKTNKLRMFLGAALVAAGLAFGAERQFGWFSQILGGGNQPPKPVPTEVVPNRFEGMTTNLEVAAVMAGCQFKNTILTPDMSQYVESTRKGFAVVEDRYAYTEAGAELKGGTPLTEKMDQVGSLLMKGLMAELIGSGTIDQQLLRIRNFTPLVRFTTPAEENLVAYADAILNGTLQDPTVALVNLPAGSEILSGYYLQRAGEGDHILGGHVFYSAISVVAIDPEQMPASGCRFTSEEIATAAGIYRWDTYSRPAP